MAELSEMPAEFGRHFYSGRVLKTGTVDNSVGDLGVNLEGKTRKSELETENTRPIPSHWHGIFAE